MSDIQFFAENLPAEDFALLLAGLAQQNNESFGNKITLDQGVVNNVQVVVADTAVISAPTTTVLESVTARAPNSVTTFGETSAQLVVILDNSINPETGVSFAQDLAGYLVRKIPVYWFSNIEISMNGISEAQRDLVAVLEIGDQIRVSKRFPNVANPVVEDLFVEGIDHKISPSNHTVILQCSPADLFTVFILDTSELDDAEVGLG
jgi:hypothetical protein